MKPATTLLAAALLAALVLMVPACTASEISAGEGESGRVTSAQLNDIVIITLPENPSTGYLWDLKATGGLFLVSDTFHRSTTKYIGGAGTRIWKYQVRETGVQSVSGSYHRPWLKPSPNDRKFVFTIQVDARSAGTPAASCPYGICKPGFGGSSTGLKQKLPVVF
jgi:inhibitor of cysteine peptidase